MNSAELLMIFSVEFWPDI